MSPQEGVSVMLDELIKAERAIDAASRAGGVSSDQAKALDARRDLARLVIESGMLKIRQERDALRLKLERQTAKLRKAAALVAKCPDATGPCDEAWGMLAELLDS